MFMANFNNKGAMKKYCFNLIIFIVALFLLLAEQSVLAYSSNGLVGRILLQVENNGEAWYVNPSDGFRYYLSRPQEAFLIMKNLGNGIRNSDLNKIPIGLLETSGNDSDGDGLSDDLEKSIGTNVYKIDSDNDGYSDKQEISNAKNPIGKGGVMIDNTLIKNNLGRIFLQVEKRGEAWYLDPQSKKRYFLGRPQDALGIMKKMGLGISNNDLFKIKTYSSDFQIKNIEKKIFDLINNEREKNGLEKLAINSELTMVAQEHSRNLAEENLMFTGIGYGCDYPMIHHEGFKFGAYNGDRLNNKGIYYYGTSAENIALVTAADIRITYVGHDPIEQEINFCEKQRGYLDVDFKKRLDQEEVVDKKIKIVKDEIVLRKNEFTKLSKTKEVDIDWRNEDDVARDIVLGWMNSPGHKKNILTIDFDESGLGVAMANQYIIATQVFIRRAKCGYENGPCCEKEGYYAYCFVPLECSMEKQCQ